MKRIALAFALSASLAACGPMMAAMGGPAPAPLAQTTIDDTGLETAWKSFDLALDAINGLTDAGIITPGTPRARAIAQGIRTVNRALASAERFAAAGSATDYGVALAEAKAGIEEIRAALRSN